MSILKENSSDAIESDPDRHFNRSLPRGKNVPKGGSFHEGEHRSVIRRAQKAVVTGHAKRRRAQRLSAKR